MGASFGHFGSALVVSILADGSVFGLRDRPQGLKHMGASSIGKSRPRTSSGRTAT
jgi:hypothetical protein